MVAFKKKMFLKLLSKKFLFLEKFKSLIFSNKNFFICFKFYYLKKGQMFNVLSISQNNSIFILFKFLRNNFLVKILKIYY